MLCAIVVVAAALGQSGSPRLVRSTGSALIMVVLVLGLSIFIGNSGVFSFGHLAFMGIGAYVTVIMRMSPDRSPSNCPTCRRGLAGAAAVRPRRGAGLRRPRGVMRRGARHPGGTAVGADRQPGDVRHSHRGPYRLPELGDGHPRQCRDDPGRGRRPASGRWSCGPAWPWWWRSAFQQTRIGMRLAASREDEIAAAARRHPGVGRARRCPSC